MVRIQAKVKVDQREKQSSRRMARRPRERGNDSAVKEVLAPNANQDHKKWVPSSMRREGAATGGPLL